MADQKGGGQRVGQRGDPTNSAPPAAARQKQPASVTVNVWGATSCAAAPWLACRRQAIWWTGGFVGWEERWGEGVFPGSDCCK